MEFNISYKSDSETGESTFNVDGDKDFAEKLTELIDNLQEIMQYVPKIIDKKIKSEKDKAELLVKETLYDIKMDEETAEKIFSANPDLMDRIITVRNDDMEVIGIKIK